MIAEVRLIEMQTLIRYEHLICRNKNVCSEMFSSSKYVVYMTLWVYGCYIQTEYNDIPGTTI